MALLLRPPLERATEGLDGAGVVAAPAGSDIEERRLESSVEVEFGSDELTGAVVAIAADSVGGTTEKVMVGTDSAGGLTSESGTCAFAEEETPCSSVAEELADGKFEDIVGGLIAERLA